MRPSAILLAAVLLPFQSASAQTVEQFYKDKQLRLVIPTEAGSEYDIWGRFVGRHMVAKLPGKPSFLPQNMPGGGQLVGANYLYSLAPQDGSAFGMIGRNSPSQALLKVAAVKFDPTKFNWLGSPESTSRVCVAMADAPVKSAKELFDTELVMGGEGAGAAITTTPILVGNVLGMKIKVVPGYAKAADIVLAMERGEVGGVCQTITAFEGSRPGWIQSGRARVLFNMERDPIPGLNAPSIFQFVKTEEQRRIIAFYSSSIELGRPFAAPPGVPADRLQALRNAFEATTKDKDFLAEAAKMKLQVTLRTGGELTALVKELMETPPDIIEKTESLMSRH